MNTVDSGIPVGSAIRRLDNFKANIVKISEADEATYQMLTGAQEMLLKSRYSQTPDLSDNPAYAAYATVRVGGKVVAEIDNNGCVTSSNAAGGRITQALSEIDEVGQGPNLAQARAELIAKLFGGTVVKSSTALTQSQFNGIPRPSATVDFEAMRQDPLFEQLQKTKQARTLFLAQQAAQS